MKAFLLVSCAFLLVGCSGETGPYVPPASVKVTEGLTRIMQLSRDGEDFGLWVMNDGRAEYKYISFDRPPTLVFDVGSEQLPYLLQSRPDRSGTYWDNEFHLRSPYELGGGTARYNKNTTINITPF